MCKRLAKTIKTTINLCFITNKALLQIVKTNKYSTQPAVHTSETFVLNYLH